MYREVLEILSQDLSVSRMLQQPWGATDHGWLIKNFR
jgi:hypothetical protein